jgi:hypothetical protein
VPCLHSTGKLRDKSSAGLLNPFSLAGFEKALTNSSFILGNSIRSCGRF